MTKDMRKWVKEQADLAVFYAEDGAYFSAARVLRDLAADCQKQAEKNAAELNERTKPA